MIRTLLRDPLAHFLIAGAAIWGLLTLIGDPVDPASRSIDLSRERQAGIALGFERMMGRPPTDAELDIAIARWVREEVLYREALRLGLDDGDAVVRRRLATKMDELAGAEAEVAQPTDDALQAWLADHRGQYASGGSVSFQQVYFASEDKAREALGQDNPKGPEITLPQTMADASQGRIAGVFGTAFAQEVAQIPARPRWQGPVQSGYGWHIVRVTNREEGKLPELAAIREQVEADWRSATIAARRKRAYDLLREAYRVDIE